MTTYKRTRVVSQDMRTGQFAYLDQLVKDGYNPGLLVLPENWEPPVRQGPSSLLPIEPIFNLSPPNITDTYPVILQNLVNIATGAAVLEMFSIGQTGIVRQDIGQNVTGVSSVGSCGAVTSALDQPSPAVASIGAASSATGAFVLPTVTGILSVGTADASGVMVVITGNTDASVTGIASAGAQGAVLNGSGWSQGGGWGSNGWGIG